MAIRTIKFCVTFLACFLFLPGLRPMVKAQAEPATEATAPKATTPVEKLLDQARQLADAKQPEDSLKAANRALELARQSNDWTGVARAQQARANALQDLQRLDEAVAAWQEAARIWAEAGDASKQITALVNAGLLCVSDKKTEAEKLFVQGLSIGKADNQPPAAVAQALYDSGIALDKQGQKQSAWDYVGAALTIREEQNPESLELVATLNALAKLAVERGVDNNDPQSYALARDYSTRAAEIGQRLAPDSPIVVETLSRLGYAERSLDSLNAAREHDLAALRIERKLEPGGSLLEADILYDLGRVEAELTNLAPAHTDFEEAVALGERLAPESLQSEKYLEMLGIAEEEEGDLAAARNHMLRGLAIKEKLNGWLAPTLLNLGTVAAAEYDFAAAREYYEKALALFIKAKPNGRGVQLALGNLRDTFYRQGDLASALEYGKRALATHEGKAPGIFTAHDLSGMGDILQAQGKLREAADFYRRALAIKEKIAPESLEISETLRDLANAARRQGDRSLATQYDLRALELGQKSCPNSWCVVGVLNDLGELAYEQGDLAGSESYLRRAVDFREQALGPKHLDVAHSLNSLALTMAALDRKPEALAMTMRAERIGAEHLRVSVRTLSERQALAYENIRVSGLDLALTLTADRTSTSLARSEVFDAVIRSRALVFDELAARHRSFYGSGDPEVKRLADQLFSARARLATLVFRGVGDNEPQEYRKLLDDAREKKEKAERMLAEKSVTFRHDQARAQLGVKEIAAALPQSSALVAFVRYARYDLQKPGVNRAARQPVPSYAAFVLRAGKIEPELVPLGAVREIESLFAAWRRDIARQAEIMDISGKPSQDNYRRLGAALRRRIWDPVVPSLGDAKEVFVVPDAVLHLLNLATLPVGSSQYLVEVGPSIHYLSTERDLVPASSQQGEGILVVGNPAFDQAGRVLVASNQQTPSTAPLILRGPRSACGTFKTLHFTALPASQREADNIADVWKRSTSRRGAGNETTFALHPNSGAMLQLTGAAASPEAFEQYAPGKRVLHVATHGFFLEGSCESAVQRSLDGDKRDESFLPATAENPLLLSGLAFAGANHKASAKADETDGILTAEEIAGMNLEGVDWAVLSACDTGVGEIRVGEGVFGLRRAFQVAGAKTVIMSLWRVEDETTRQWMATLYKEHFINGHNTGESIRAASLQILRQLRTRHQSTHPFYWGAFIAAGDWH